MHFLFNHFVVTFLEALEGPFEGCAGKISPRFINTFAHANNRAEVNPSPKQVF